MHIHTNTSTSTRVIVSLLSQVISGLPVLPVLPQVLISPHCGNSWLLICNQSSLSVEKMCVCPFFVCVCIWSTDPVATGWLASLTCAIYFAVLQHISSTEQPNMELIQFVFTLQPCSLWIDPKTTQVLFIHLQLAHLVSFFPLPSYFA